MKKLFSIFLLSLFTIAAFAQNTVTGSVKDAVTGEPLAGVGVIVSTGGGTITDEDGSFPSKQPVMPPSPSTSSAILTW